MWGIPWSRNFFEHRTHNFSLYIKVKLSAALSPEMQVLHEVYVGGRGMKVGLLCFRVHP